MDWIKWPVCIGLGGRIDWITQYNELKTYYLKNYLDKSVHKPQETGLHL